jgi:hypothetical protein
MRRTKFYILIIVVLAFLYVVPIVDVQVPTSSRGCAVPLDCHSLQSVSMHYAGIGVEFTHGTIYVRPFGYLTLYRPLGSIALEKV